MSDHCKIERMEDSPPYLIWVSAGNPRSDLSNLLHELIGCPNPFTLLRIPPFDVRGRLRATKVISNVLNMRPHRAKHGATVLAELCFFSLGDRCKGFPLRTDVQLDRLSRIELSKEAQRVAQDLVRDSFNLVHLLFCPFKPLRGSFFVTLPSLAQREVDSNPKSNDGADCLYPSGPFGRRPRNMRESCGQNNAEYEPANCDSRLSKLLRIVTFFHCSPRVLGGIVA